MNHRIIEILGLRPSNRLPVSYYNKYDFMVYLGKKSLPIITIFLTKCDFFFALSYPMKKLLCESIVHCDFY
jgi:hypothetical protein